MNTAKRLATVAHVNPFSDSTIHSIGAAGFFGGGGSKFSTGGSKYGGGPSHGIKKGKVVYSKFDKSSYRVSKPKAMYSSGPKSSGKGKHSKPVKAVKYESKHSSGKGHRRML
jgi:hypothetical protein